MSVLIYSGGLDSTVLLYKLATEGKASLALGFNYGQRHSKELEFAQENCKRLGVKWQCVNLDGLGELFGKNSLTDANVEVPNGHYANENMKTTVVPNRNMIMLSLAAARAIAIGDNSVAYAAHGGDHDIYPDCRPDFANAMDAALALCHYEPISLLRPFANMSKAEIVAIGAKLGVDFSKTWSCYKGEDLHCGSCGTCLERRQAFKLAGVTDPTQYASPEQ